MEIHARIVTARELSYTRQRSVSRVVGCKGKKSLVIVNKDEVALVFSLAILVVPDDVPSRLSVTGTSSYL